jgi:hypothetical protein
VLDYHVVKVILSYEGWELEVLMGVFVELNVVITLIYVGFNICILLL